MKKILGILFMIVGITAVCAQTPTTLGSIKFTGKQMGISVEGQFRKFSSQIQLNPANPTAGKVSIDVDVTSVDIGLDDYNQELRSKTWLDAKTYPKATFVSSAIKSTGAGKLDVSGKLTIKGKTLDVIVPVTLKTEGATRVLEGALPIQRNAFNIGEGEWKDTKTVADDVQILFRVIAVNK